MSLAASSVTRAFSRDLTATTDRDLVATAVAGVEGSFEELVRRYQRPISAYVYRMVGNYESALDLTQEIFIKVYSSLERYRSEFKFSTWIYKIAHNAAVDHLRRNATREQRYEWCAHALGKQKGFGHLHDSCAGRFRACRSHYS